MQPAPITLEGRHVRLEPLHFSILDDEWPEVKRRLEERLAKGG